MKEEELVVAHHVGDVINIIQETTHHLFDPDDLLTVSQLSLSLHACTNTHNHPPIKNQNMTLTPPIPEYAQIYTIVEVNSHTHIYIHVDR